MASELLVLLVLLLRPLPALVLLGALAEGAAAAAEEVHGEAECRAEYLGSCRLPPPPAWAMAKGCLLLRDIIIILAGGRGARAPAGSGRRRGGKTRAHAQKLPPPFCAAASVSCLLERASPAPSPLAQPRPPPATLRSPTAPPAASPLAFYSPRPPFLTCHSTPQLFGESPFPSPSYPPSASRILLRLPFPSPALLLLPACSAQPNPSLPLTEAPQVPLVPPAPTLGAPRGRPPRPA